MAKEIKPKGRSFDQTRSLVSDALKLLYPSAGYTWINELYSDVVIFSVENSNANPRSTTYAANYTVSASNAVSVKDVQQVTAKKVYESVAVFSIDVPDFDTADFSGDGEIVKDCLLFRCGDYPDKGLRDYTPEKADFALLPNLPGLRLEALHPKIDPVTGESDSEWSGKLGKGVVDARRVGDDVFGRVSFSQEVVAALKGTKPALSISIHTATGKPVELSLVDVPRIAGAGVLAEFSGGNPEPKKESPKVRKGASMSLKDKLAEMLGLSKKEVEDGMSEFSNENPEVAAELADLKVKYEALKQGHSTFSAVSVSQFANQIADSIIVAEKATPAERDALVSHFSATLTADNGVTSFSAETGLPEYGPLTKAAIAREMARPALNLGISQFYAVKPEGEKPKMRSSSEIYADRNGGGN